MNNRNVLAKETTNSHSTVYEEQSVEQVQEINKLTLAATGDLLANSSEPLSWHTPPSTFKTSPIGLLSPFQLDPLPPSGEVSSTLSSPLESKPLVETPEVEKSNNPVSPTTPLDEPPLGSGTQPSNGTLNQLVGTLTAEEQNIVCLLKPHSVVFSNHDQTQVSSFMDKHQKTLRQKMPNVMGKHSLIVLTITKSPRHSAMELALSDFERLVTPATYLNDTIINAIINLIDSASFPNVAIFSTWFGPKLYTDGYSGISRWPQTRVGIFLGIIVNLLRIYFQFPSGKGLFSTIRDTHTVIFPLHEPLEQYLQVGSKKLRTTQDVGHWTVCSINLQAKQISYWNSLDSFDGSASHDCFEVCLVQNQLLHLRHYGFHRLQSAFFKAEPRRRKKSSTEMIGHVHMKR
jgi:hypothetical protein